MSIPISVELAHTLTLLTDKLTRKRMPQICADLSVSSSQRITAAVANAHLFCIAPAFALTYGFSKVSIVHPGFSRTVFYIRELHGNGDGGNTVVSAVIPRISA